MLQVIIVTSSLMKDMNSKTDLYRANAIRVLCRITDGGLLGQIERYLKQAVVDKNPVVSSAALVSGIHLLQVQCLGEIITIKHALTGLSIRCLLQSYKVICIL
jgi:vesicle coat complex subunit